MPKKSPKNAFYFFMVDFKEKERKRGVNYANMVDVANAAGSLWKEATPEVRVQYEAIAKNEKMTKCGVAKLTSNGIPLSEIERQEKELQDAEESERKDIKNLVKLKTFNGDIVYEDFYIMDVNFYTKTSTQHIIGESTILRFNLKDGICDSYHEMINIGYIPTGYASDVKLGCQNYGLPPPDDSKPRSNFMQILANTIDYLKTKDRNAKIVPPIFTMPEKILPVHDFIVQMCTRAGEDDEIFRVYRLDTLYFTLINAIKSREDEGFPKESLALVQLRKDVFKYNPGLGCAHHEESDRAVECTTSRVKRWAFSVLDSCCPVAGIDLVPGKHVPFEYDMAGILSYKEQKKGRMVPSVAPSLGTSTCNSSISDSFNESVLNSTTDSEKKEKRVHVPVRMPKKDTTRRWPAPELTEQNFPALNARQGRGRGLAGSFNRLKLE